MTQLACPFCGLRELEEFSFHKTLPSSGAAPFADTYLRANHRDVSAEHWQHVRGCRAWLEVTRNPSTGKVLDVKLIGSVRA
jgi:methylglutamate dehydrogenase subunit B